MQRFRIKNFKHLSAPSLVVWFAFLSPQNGFLDLRSELEAVVRQQELGKSPNSMVLAPWVEATRSRRGAGVMVVAGLYVGMWAEKIETPPRQTVPNPKEIARLKTQLRLQFRQPSLRKSHDQYYVMSEQCVWKHHLMLPRDL